MKKYLLPLCLILCLTVVPLFQINVNANTIKTNEIKLVIATRHDSIIYNKFAEEFVKSSYASGVGISNVNELQFWAPSDYDGFRRVMSLDEINADVGWGGGPTLFTSLWEDNALTPITDTELLDLINSSIPNTIAGADMKYTSSSDDMVWVASAISSFGFTINHDTIAERGLSTPSTWEDLASPEFFTTLSESNVGLGNAPDTTSNTRIYQILIQKFGWEGAWDIIYRMAGNGKIYGGSTETLNSVISGETAAAMTIDFYGLNAQVENPSTEYIVPEGASIVNGDPIALAVTPSHLDAANAFIKFVLSQEGQSLWLTSNINRLPIREDAFDTPLGQTRDDIYQLFNSTLTNLVIDFDEGLALSFEEAMRSHFEATVTNVHTKLRTAWSTMLSAKSDGAINDSQYNEFLATFIEPEITQAEAISANVEILADQDARRDYQTTWTEGANAKLDLINNVFAESLSYDNPNVEDTPFDFASYVYWSIFLGILTIHFRKNRNKL